MRETGFRPACRTTERPRQKQVGQAPSGNRGAARRRVHPEVHREALQFFACQPRKLAEEALNQETEAVKSYGGFGTFEPLGPTTAAGRLTFGIFAALAEFERELIRERTMAGLKSARARGRKGGRKFALTKAQVRMAQAAMASRDTSVSELCKELGVTPVTLYRYVDPNGNLRDHGKRVLSV